MRVLTVTPASNSALGGPLLLFGSRSSRADRALRVCAIAIAAWLVITLSAVVHYARSAGDMTALVAHLLALGMVCFVVLRDERAPLLLRDWLPLLFLPFLYIEARWPIAGLGRAHADATVHSWELAFFPSDPSRTLATQWHALLLSEALHLAYLSYYVLIYLPPAVLYLRGVRGGFAETMLALSVAFGACFTAFLLFPVDGPRFVNGGAAAPDGPVRALTLALLNGASTRGTAFPSSHVAASVVATVCALRFSRPLGYLLIPVTLALMVATVYGGFHYAVDVMAGLVVGAASLVVAAFIWKALE